MKKHILIILFFSISLINVYETESIELYNNFIISPMFGMPAIWLRKDESQLIKPFIKIDSLKIKSVLPIHSEEFSILLRKSTGPVSFDIELPVKSVEKNGSDYLFYISIPEKIPVDLYDLDVAVRTEEAVFSDFQPNSVKIIDKIKEDYFIIHVTDIHVDDVRGYMFNYTETAEYRVIKKMMNMVNLLDPEFVIITGDNVFGESYLKEYKDLYDLLQDFDVPVFMSIGNHDAVNHKVSMAIEKIDGKQIFENLFAPVNFSFLYGGLKYISLDSTDWSQFARRGVGIITPTPGGQMREKQLDWFENELAATEEELILVGYHHPPQNSFQGVGSERLMSLSRDYNVAAVLNGHTHHDEALIDDSVVYLTTGSLLFSGFDGSYPAIRMIEVSNSNLVSWNYEEPYWSVPVYRDSAPYSLLWNLSVSSLYCVYKPSNNGNSSTVTATLTNNLIKDYSGINLEFVMPIPEYGKTYRVTGGEVNDMYDTGDYQIWYVKTDIAAESEKEVTIKNTGE
jgi:predicted MPP superfamily phosphohydrolase